MLFHFRNATPDDWDFIWSLRVATLKDMIQQSYGWVEATQRSYAEESLNGEVVLVDDKPVGVLTLSDWTDQLHLTWMAVAPEMQRRGLGGALIQHAQLRASNAGKPLTLQVLRNNPAVSLYEKCGFEICGHSGPHMLLMRWEPRAMQQVMDDKI